MAVTLIAKCIFMLFNVLCLIISIAIMAFGTILAFVLDEVHVLDFVYDAVKKAANAVTDGYTFPESAEALMDLPMIHEIGLALLVLGIILFTISFLGCCGCCCSCCKIMLILFVIVMAVFMIAEIVIVTMFYVPNSPVISILGSGNCLLLSVGYFMTQMVDEGNALSLRHRALHEKLREALKDKLHSYDGNLKTKDSFSVAINMVNYYFECCGIDGALDFTPSPPLSCTNPKTLKQNSEGCYTKLTDVIQDNIIYAGVAFAALLLFQLIQMIFAWVIYKKSNKISPF